MKITLRGGNGIDPSFKAISVANLVIDGQSHILGLGDTLTIDEPVAACPSNPDRRHVQTGHVVTCRPATTDAEAILGHEPLAALDAERFAVTPHLRDYWTKGPGSTTPRWPEQDRSTTMHDYDQPMPETVPAKNDPLDHLDDVIDDLDGELEGLAAALVTVLRPEMTTIQTDSTSGERVGPDDRSPRRQRIDMLSARIQRMTREMRTLHERIDL